MNILYDKYNYLASEKKLYIQQDFYKQNTLP